MTKYQYFWLGIAIQSLSTAFYTYIKFFKADFNYIITCHVIVGINALILIFNLLRNKYFRKTKWI